MIIDTSALMCILQAEPEARAIARALAQDGTRGSVPDLYITQGLQIRTG